MNLNTYSRQNLINITSLISIVALFILCYFDTFKWMIDRYLGTDSYYSHGFLVPLVTAYLIWQNRILWKDEPISYSIVGLILIITSAILHIIGTILYIFSISGFSIFLMIFGIVLYLAGWKKTKAISFPLLFIIFMIPLPLAIINLISFPLKMFAANVGVWLVNLMGIPVYREGFNIFIPAGHLLVGNPCSGLRSLIAFLALGSIFSYLSDLSQNKKIILFLLTIPIALFSNITRIPILIVASHIWGLQAAAPDTIVHTGSGLLVFVIGCILLYLISKVLVWET